MRGEHRHGFPAGKGLIDGNRRRHELAEAIESLGRADPDVAFAILERTKNVITRQTIRRVIVLVRSAIRTRPRSRVPIHRAPSRVRSRFSGVNGCGTPDTAYEVTRPLTNEWRPPAMTINADAVSPWTSGCEVWNHVDAFGRGYRLGGPVCPPLTTRVSR